LADKAFVEVKLKVKEQGGDKIYDLSFYLDEKLVAKRVYKKGETIAEEGKIPDGVVIEKFEDGKIKNVISYKDGKRNGRAIGFYKNGRIKVEAHYKNDDPTKLTRFYFEDGGLMSEVKYEGKQKVYYKEYHKNGNLKEEIYYLDDEAISKSYDIKGNPIVNQRLKLD
jgi:antitoxin component YwqK of YwqJK toxin-antitoxin module